MPPLSNFGPKRDVPSAGTARAPAAGGAPVVSVLECRAARPSEVDAALRLLLAGPDGRASDDQVHGFLAVASHRGLDVNTMWVAAQGNRLLWAFLPVISPGRTVLLLSPPRLAPSIPLSAIGSLVDALCAATRAKGIDLAQMLLDPNETSLRQLYVQLGFAELAELIYLQRSVKRITSQPPMAPSLRTMTYSPATHALFIQAIAGSYENSLDCPALNGLRTMEDVLLGHQASGEFDPSLWFLLMDHGNPRGVLLLTRTANPTALELVYLGLTREARGRGHADLLMNLALLSVVRQNRTELTLAVDSRNAPALKLYHRHGLKRIGSRAALIRDLRSTPPERKEGSPPQ